MHRKERKNARTLPFKALQESHEVKNVKMKITPGEKIKTGAMQGGGAILQTPPYAFDLY